MRKPIKPSKSLVYCYACKRRKMLFGEQSEADIFIKYNHGGIAEENGKAPVRSYYCELCCGYHVTSNPSKEEGEKMDRQDSRLINELTSITQAMDKFKTIEMMVRLRKMEQSILEMSSYPDAESREDYKLKKEEIGRYLASIRPIVGRKVTASYRRKIGLCS